MANVYHCAFVLSEAKDLLLADATQQASSTTGPNLSIPSTPLALSPLAVPKVLSNRWSNSYHAQCSTRGNSHFGGGCEKPNLAYSDHPAFGFLVSPPACCRTAVGAARCRLDCLGCHL